jgi:hypothetical protein
MLVTLIGVTLAVAVAVAVAVAGGAVSSIILRVKRGRDGDEERNDDQTARFGADPLNAPRSGAKRGGAPGGAARGARARRITGAFLPPS